MGYVTAPCNSSIAAKPGFHLILSKSSLKPLNIKRD